MWKRCSNFTNVSTLTQFEMFAIHRDGSHDKNGTKTDAHKQIYKVKEKKENEREKCSFLNIDNDKTKSIITILVMIIRY